MATKPVRLSAANAGMYSRGGTARLRLWPPLGQQGRTEQPTRPSCDPSASSPTLDLAAAISALHSSVIDATDSLWMRRKRQSQIRRQTALALNVKLYNTTQCIVTCLCTPAYLTAKMTAGCAVYWKVCICIVAATALPWRCGLEMLCK